MKILVNVKQNLPAIWFCFFFLFFFISITPCLSDGQQALPDFLKRVKKNASLVHSFSCNFTQERHLSLFPEPVIFTGNLKLVRPDRLRWAFTDPIPSVVIFDGEKGIRCSDNQEPIHFDLKTDPIMRVVAKQLWSWLNNDYDELAKEYTIEVINDYSLRITPSKLSTSEFIESVTITFDTKNSHPKQVVIKEMGEDFTRIEFSNYSLNSPLPKSTFTTCY